MRISTLATVFALGACDPQYRETQCQEYDSFSGQRTDLEHAIATHDGYQIEWRFGLYEFYSQRVDATGQPLGSPQVGAEEYTLFSTATDRELYRRGEATLELRTHAGDLVGAPLAATLHTVVGSEGNAFVLVEDGQGRRLALDGSVGAAFSIPQPVVSSYIDGVASSANVTWIMSHYGDTVEVTRLARGGAPLDSVPRTVTDQAPFSDFVVTSQGVAVLGSSRDQLLTLYTVTEDGAVTSAPVEILPAPRRLMGMIAEPDGYLALFDDGEPIALRISATGVVTDVIEWEDWSESGIRLVRGSSSSLCVFDRHTPMNEFPTLRTMHVPFGAAPAPSTVLASSVGEIKRNDCGCSTTRPTTLLPLLALVLLRRARRARGSRSASS